MYLRLLFICALIFSAYAAHSQNVGVGTTSPEQKLHVKGNIQLDDTSNVMFNTQLGDTSGIRFITEDSIYGSMLYSADEKTLNFSSNDTVNGLHMNFNTGKTFVGRDYEIGPNEIFGLTKTFNGGVGFTGMHVESRGAAANRPYYGYAVDGLSKGFHYFDGTSEQWRLFMGGTRMSIRRDNGYVGIGVTTPLAKLHVVDTIRIENADKPALQFYRSGVLNGSLYQEGFTTVLNTSILGGSINLATGGLNRLSVFSDGRIVVADKLGIGGIAPLDPLHVIGNMRLVGVVPELKFYNGLTQMSSFQQNGTNLFISNKTVTGKLFLRTQDIPRMTLDADGRVGIGTTVPNANLEVVGSVLFDTLGVGVANILARTHLRGTMRIDNFSTQLPGIDLYGNGSDLTGRLAANSQHVFLSNESIGDIIFKTSGDNTMLVRSLGVVDINGVRPLLRLVDGATGLGSVYHDGADMDISNWLIAGKLHFRTESTKRMTITPNGQVGIGIEDPIQALHIIGDLRVDNANPTMELTSMGANRGTISHNGTHMTINNLWNGQMIFKTLDSERMSIGQQGVVIGASTGATGYMLSVHGKVMSEELKVQLFENWPDYVFHDDYDLMPLKDTKEFIEKNGHLPGVPSASEIKENQGFEVGEMNRLLLEKIEELTLHLIKLEAELESLRSTKNADSQ